MKKIIPAVPNLSNDQVEALLAEISDLSLNQNQMTASLDADRLALDARLLPIKEAARPAMEAKADALHAVTCTMHERIDTLERWARAHQSEHFTPRRSLHLLHGVIGFRLTKPRLEERPRRTFRRAAWWLARLTWGRRYLRPAPINKEAILKDRALFEARPERLRKIGVAIVQDDEFYVEPAQIRSDLQAAAVPMKEAA